MSAPNGIGAVGLQAGFGIISWDRGYDDMSLARVDRGFSQAKFRATFEMSPPQQQHDLTACGCLTLGDPGLISVHSAPFPTNGRVGSGISGSCFTWGRPVTMVLCRHTTNLRHKAEAESSYVPCTYISNQINIRNLRSLFRKYLVCTVRIKLMERLITFHWLP